MDVVGAMAAYLPVVRVCTAQSREASLDCAVHTRTTGVTAILAKHCVRVEVPDDGSLVIRNMFGAILNILNIDCAVHTHTPRALLQF